MKQGFTLIEFAISLLLAGILTTLVFQAVSVINSAVLRSDSIIDLDTRIAIINNQLQKDISGIFVPIQAHDKKKDAKKKDAKDTKEQPKEKKEAEKKTSPVKRTAKKIVVDKVFYAKNKNKTLNVLSFISNNPLRVYEKADNGFFSPCFIRVVYRFEEQKEKKGHFRLLRQESTNLDFKAFDKDKIPTIRSFELAEDIKQIKGTYYAVKLEDKKDETKKEEKKKRKYSKKEEWDIKNTKDKKESIIPEFVEFVIQLWDDQGQESEVTLKYRIPSFPGYMYERLMPQKKDQQSPKKPEEKDTKKAESPGAKQQIEQIKSTMEKLTEKMERT